MTRVACIDIGTVTARLAVADVEDGRVVRLAKRSQICNLGQDVDKTHRLRQDAMERVFGCVAAYLEEARRAGATSACCTLTSAARDAQNACELGAALASLGLEPMVIPGAVEGSLTFLGVAQDFVGHRILVADNGGGSTELAMGCLGADGILELDFVRSVDVGCRRLTERFLAGEGPAAPQDLLAARELAGQKFAPVIAEGGLRAASGEKPAGSAARAFRTSSQAFLWRSARRCRASSPSARPSSWAASAPWPSSWPRPGLTSSRSARATFSLGSPLPPRPRSSAVTRRSSGSPRCARSSRRRASRACARLNGPLGAWRNWHTQWT